VFCSSSSELFTCLIKSGKLLANNVKYVDQNPSSHVNSRWDDQEIPREF
jgi:hypothetical protein